MRELPYITPKQASILKLLYTYRHLDRKQLQAFLHHKDKRRVISWLKDLREKQYVEWIYSTDFAEKTKPAIYYLGINGIRYLRYLHEYAPAALQKRYREAERSRSFVDRNILVASCALALDTVPFRVITETDYTMADHSHSFLGEHEVLRPNLCIVKHTKRGEVITNYLLEIFDASLPRYRWRRRLKAYVWYLEDNEWDGEGPRPVVLLVCPTVSDLIYAKRLTKLLIEDTYAEEGELHIRFTTAEQLQSQGIRAHIWEEGRARFGV